MANFAERVGRWARKARLNLDDAQRGFMFDAFASAVRRSPVDTGRFRASWRLVISGRFPRRPEPPRREHSGPNFGDPITRDEASEAQRVLQGLRFGNASRLHNGLPYAPLIENGHSQMAPAGVLRLAFEDAKRKLRERVRRLERGERGF